jgi:uncharacterized membrane protein YfcA
MLIVGLFLAALMGISLGLLGGGGSILAVPIFKYALGFGAKEAIASSLAVVGATSLVGAASHWREGRVRLRTGLVFGFVAMAGAFLGAKYLAPFLSGSAQLALFGAVMLIAALFMLRESESAKDTLGTEKGSLESTYLLLLFALGGAVGILTGLVGVGGGFLIVPALVLLAKLPMKEAVGTSLLVISMNSLAGFAGYLGEVSFKWELMALFAVLAVAGSFAGTYLVKFVPQRMLNRSFAVFLVLMAAFILYENRGAMPVM